MHLVDITMFYAAEGGGVSTYLNAKARWLAGLGWARHTIFSPNVSESDADDSEGTGAPTLVRVPAVTLPGIHGYRMPLSVAAAVRLLRAAQPDLVEAGDAGHCAWAALRLQQRLGIPAVAFYHSDLPRLVENRFGHAISQGSCKYLAHLYREFDLVLAPSRLMVHQLDDMGVAHALHQPLGIDSEIFHPSRRRATLRTELGLPGDVRLLVYAGRFTADKKLPVLIDAVGKLGPRYHLLLVGGGAELPRHPHVSFMPFQRDQRALAGVLASCDLLVHPGDCETFGLIVLEAMACGLPVVATTGGGVAELVDEQTGILARPNDVDSLAGAIEAIYARDMGRLGAQARHKAQEQYDWRQVFPQLMHRYGSLLAARPGARHALDRVCVSD
ncbi:glycosyltransferase family 4 protein [Massilia agri]|uniref:Glycosyltransferase family 1 protein n=1 Tax=Massilia agri TaxID=1886785 RepID=A0ABT2ARE8_9BURK|nr:glycosyltransferase family 1 protein [Massilia agri]MCS0598807.1 glycosyltransferase family 1 protein [Massilia agri]